MIKTILPRIIHRRPFGTFHTGLVLLWIVMAIVFRSYFPMFFWASLAILPAFVIYQSEKNYLRSSDGRKVLIICLGIFTIHTGWAIYRSSIYSPGTQETYWRDDMNYYREATVLAEAWKTGFYPDISLKGSPPYLGTLHTGYHRPLTTLFLISGSSILAALLLNAVCASLLPIFAALSARYLWDDNINKPGNKTDIGFLAAGLTALHPAQYYWSSFILKDVFTAFCFMALLTLTLGSFRQKSPALSVTALFLFPYSLTVRAYMAISVLAGVMAIPLLNLKRKQVYLSLIISIILLVIICNYTHPGGQLYRQLRDSFLALAPPNLNSPLSLLTQTLQGIPALFMAPYAWLIFPEPMPMYGLYPAMWYLYIVIYPLAFAGLYAALKQNIRLSIIPFAACTLASLLFLTASYSGVAPRQRYYIEYVFILFAAYGIIRPSRAWIISILSLELTFGIGQILSLH